MNDGVTSESWRRYFHARAVLEATEAADAALVSAVLNGRRTDCLRAAVEALRGALRCVEWEDSREDGGVP